MISLIQIRWQLIYLLGSPHREPQVLELLDRPAALHVLRHRHLHTVDGQAGDVGGETCGALVALLAKVRIELGDAEAVPGGLDGVAVEEDVLRRELDITAIRGCADLYIMGSDRN
jgi:hypothetical protein